MEIAGDQTRLPRDILYPYSIRRYDQPSPPVALFFTPFPCRFSPSFATVSSAALPCVHAHLHADTRSTLPPPLERVTRVKVDKLELQNPL